MDGYLSSALGVPLKEGRLQDIDEAKYVLTLDYTVKVCSVMWTLLMMSSVYCMEGNLGGGKRW